MDACDQKKLCMQGFTIIRKCDTNKPHIRYKNSDNPNSWRKLHGKDYCSKAERDRVMKKLKEIITYVED